MALDAAIERLLVEARERPAPDPESLTIDERRRRFRSELVQLGRDPAPVALVQERTIDLVDRRLDARLYVPHDERPGAVILFAHGGSFVAGDLDSHDWLCRRLASDLRTRILALDYRRAPEHPFPAAVEDVVEAILYLQAHRGDVGRSDDRVIVMGDSAGANLATVACRIVRDDADLAGQVLLYPTLGTQLVTDSAHRYATGYAIEVAQLALDYGRYLAGASPTDWRVSPLLCGDLHGVAPAIIVVAECDPLRDEAVAYAGLLEHFGVPVELLEAEGMVHGFIRYGAVVPNALAIIDHLAEHVTRFVEGDGVNVLFVTLDQFRADSFGAAGHPVVRTPTLDRIAREGARLTHHYSQAAPCSPGRAALYTGTYQMNNRVVANGTPLDRRLDNLARLARRAGYDPTLFGYTDQGVDPADALGPNDPRLDDYDGVLPGFSVGLYLPNSQAGFIQYLRARGYEVESGWRASVLDEPSRPAEHSLSAFLTDRFLAWIDRQEPGWFAHLSYLRPHPPYGAAGEYARLYSPDDCPPAIAPVESAARHPLHAAALHWSATAALDPGEVARMRAQYYGMVSEVDAQLGRVVAAIEARGEWDDTIVVVTSDHGDQLGDHGLKEKLGFFPQSYHILGLWRDPRLAPRVIGALTENVDLLATVAESLGLEVPAQCDGRSLGPLLRGEPVEWRTAAHYEWDSRFMLLVGGDPPPGELLARRNLCVTLTAQVAYVQFGDGSFLCFDLAADPTWRTPCVEPDRVLAAAQVQLVWRQVHLRREGTDVVLSPERWGNWPAALRPQAVA